MCFHTSLTKEERKLEERFKVASEYSEVYKPYFHRNGFSNGFIYIIKQNEPNRFTPSYWGLLPENLEISERKQFLNKTNTLNARSENLFTSSLFKQHIKRQRCLILADGFFEPHKRNNESFPHYIRYKNKDLFTYAGIYSELDDDLYTASIITTIANPFFKGIHNQPSTQGDYRMPLILDESNEFDWLDESLTENQISELLFTFTSNEFEAYPVTKDVMNSHKQSNNLQAIQPFHYDALNTLF
ncbi:SOS response-associated peptidase [Lacinutrix cladophorae]